MDFHKWIEEKYQEWSGGGKRSESQFAVFLGISQPTVNGWLHKTKGVPKTGVIINILLDKFGDDSRVYEVLGIAKPTDRPDYVNFLLNIMTDDQLTEWVSLGRAILMRDKSKPV